MPHSFETEGLLVAKPLCLFCSLLVKTSVWEQMNISLQVLGYRYSLAPSSVLSIGNSFIL